MFKLTKRTFRKTTQGLIAFYHFFYRYDKIWNDDVRSMMIIIYYQAKTLMGFLFGIGRIQS